jgi:hypothetical protein
MIERRPLLRAAILFLVLGPIAIAMMPSDLRSSLALKLTYYLGPLLLAPLVGGVVGWIAYSRRVFYWTTGIVATVLIVLLLKVLFPEAEPQKPAPSNPPFFDPLGRK